MPYVIICAYSYRRCATATTIISAAAVLLLVLDKCVVSAALFVAMIPIILERA